MPEVTIIADDLTGAADCGIVFAVAGLPTFVAFGDPGDVGTRDVGTPYGTPTKVPYGVPTTQVVAVDTDSRGMAAGAAAERVLGAARAACRNGSRILYKKIDSTLRGNVGAEIGATYRAAAEARGRALVILSPAFPSTGRTVRDGRVLVNGVPLDQTEVWQKSGMSGPADPVAMLAAAGLETVPLGLATVRTGLPEALARTPAQAVVCDAESEGDLAEIARAGASLPVAVVWAGSAGLARHLPRALALRPSAPTAASQKPPSGPILALVGSRSSVAREQARLLAQEPGVESFVLDPGMLLQGEGAPEWTRMAASVERALAAGADAVLRIDAGQHLQLEHAPLLAAALGRFAGAYAARIGGLIATGGDIARAVLGAIAASGLYLLGEVEPGVPIGFTDTARPLPVVTKAGAFGTPSTLQRCRAALKRPRQPG